MAPARVSRISAKQAPVATPGSVTTLPAPASENATGLDNAVVGSPPSDQAP
jgi:hypothetical protein